MTSAPDPTSGGGSLEERYQALVESFLVRCRSGEMPSIEEYAGRDPLLSERIRTCFPAMAVLEKIQDPSRASSTGAGARTVGRYRLLREVGRGGMGVVYEAEQEQLHRRVALKMLPLHASKDPRRLERFRREAQAVAKLQHPHIVQIYDFGEEEGLLYYAMQLIDGAPLHDLLPEVRRLRGSSNLGRLDRDETKPDKTSSTLAMGLLCGPLEPARSEAPDLSARGRTEPVQAPSAEGYFRSIAGIGRQVADALSYAHGQGVIHRDIKPSNLLLDGRGWVWVADFGLAKEIEAEGLTQSGEFVGTLQYMAPEQLRGVSDPRSDLYSLGMTLYELLTLRLPFEEAAPGALFEKVLAEEPLRPSDVDGSIPPELDAIVWKAIAKRPEARYQAAGELGMDLERFLAGRPVRAIASPARPGRRGARGGRRPLLAALGIAAVLLGAGLGIWILRQHPSGPVVSIVPTGIGPTAVTALDLDGDALPDLAVANFGAASVTLLRNEGHGTFSRRADLAVNGRAWSLAAGDFDGDGDPDLVVALGRGTSSLALLRSDGKGGFSPQESLETGAGPIFVLAVDLDGDRDIDLVTADGDSKGLSILRNGGDGDFSLEPAISLPDEPWSAAAADLDRDGDLDLAAAGGTNGVWVLLQSSGNSFAPPVQYRAGAQPNCLCAADLNGDGAADLCVANAGSFQDEALDSVSVLLNRGNGSFAPAVHYPAGDRVYGVATVDWDRDGDLDLAASNENSETVTFLWNRGDGTFQERRDVAAGKGPHGLCVADLDGNGTPDLAVTDFKSASILLLLNK